MTTNNGANREVTLAEVLACREARVEQQRLFLARGQGTVLSFTVVMPGPVKDSDDARWIFGEGLSALAAVRAERGIPLVDRLEHTPATGPEALWLLDAAPMAVKGMAVGIEVRHPLGRLFDLDVLDAEGVPISRSAIGAPPRSCLLCGKPAALCARSRAHAVEDLLKSISALVVTHRTLKKKP